MQHSFPLPEKQIELLDEVKEQIQQPASRRWPMIALGALSGLLLLVLTNRRR